MNQSPLPSAAAAIGRGSTCVLHLEIHLQDGTLALSTRGEVPLRLTLGDGTLTPGFEGLLLGMTAGQRVRLLAHGDDLYGPHDPEAIHWLPLADFPPGQEMAPGLVVAFCTPGGQETAGLVLDVVGQQVRVDLNHPLSGRPLNIEIEILAVTPAALPSVAEGPGPMPASDLCSRPMNILIANPRGFCAGVDRAIDIVERAIELFGAPIYVRHDTFPPGRELISEKSGVGGQAVAVSPAAAAARGSRASSRKTRRT